jgi:CubicO group peptidase (beta-lactamase class C family)
MDTAKPEKVGFSSERLGRINAVMQKYVDEGKCAGILTMVARRGQIAHLDCFGMMDVEAGKPMQPDTIFRIFSMSKPVTSVAVMMLYEEGFFQLNTPVSEFIPGFEDTKVFVQETESGLELADMEREMTIHDLLTHTSGLSYGFHEDTPVDALYRDARQNLGGGATLEKMVETLSTLPLAFQPGQGWRYSFSTDVLGYVVQVICGQSFDVFLQQRIFEPLGMVDTGFYVPAAKIDRFAALYGGAGEGELELMEAPATGRYAKPPAFLSGGGGLVSTVHDYVRFAQMLLNGGELDSARLLGRKTVELMMMNHLPEALLPFTVNPGEPPAWGYGFGLGGKVMMDPARAGVLGSRGEYSWSGAASTGFWVDPREEVVGLIMTQLMPYQPLVNVLRVLVYQALAD